MLRGIFAGLIVTCLIAFPGCGGKKTAQEGGNGAPGTSTGGGAVEPFAYVSGDFIGAVVVNPSALLKSSIGTELMNHEFAKKELADMPFNPQDAERVLVLMDAPTEGPAPPRPGTVIHWVKALDDAQAAALLADTVGDEPEDATHAGQAYKKGPYDCAAITNGGKTMVSGSEEMLKKMLDAATPPDSPLLTKLKALDPKQGVASVILLSSMKDTLAMAAAQAQSPQAPPWSAPFAEVADKLTEVQWGFDLTQKNVLEVKLSCTDEESAQKLSQAATQALQIGKVLYPQLQAQLNVDASNADLVKALDALVASVAVTQDGTTVQLVAERPEGIDAIAGKLVDKAMAAAQGPPDEWKKHEFAEQKFAAMFPQEPNVNAIPSQPDSDFGPLKQWYISSFSNETERSFTIEVRKLRPDDFADGPAKFLEDQMEFEDAKEKKEVMVGGFPGVNYTTEFDFGDKKAYQRHLIVIANDMFYHLEADVDDEKGNVPEFFDSLQILKGE